VNKPICLITPPSPFLVDERVFPSLGILKVAACLEEAGIGVEMMDLSGVENHEEAITAHVKGSAATQFGITATSPQLPAALSICRAIRSARGDAKVILGGPHITLICAALKLERKNNALGRADRAFTALAKEFDVLVAGDGEDAILLAVKDDSPHLIDADDPKGPLFMTNERLNKTPWPARHLLDMDSYNYKIEGVKATSAVFQLGCPFVCTFCSGRLSPMLRRIRTRTTENIIAEMEFLYRTYSIKAMMAFDDELNVNPKMIELMDAMADLQRRMGVEFKMRGFIKSQLFTDAQAQAMSRAGFKWILIGFESGSDRILENINKKASREDNTRCMEIARRNGLKVKALMSLGHAGESEQTVLETKEWLLEVKPDDFDATVITTYPGSPYWDSAVPHSTIPNVWTFTAPKSGDRLHSMDVDFTKDVLFYKGAIGEYKSFVFTDHLGADDLVRLRDNLERDIRAALNIPYNAGAPGIRFEASMGMTKLPPNILRSSLTDTPLSVTVAA
jgi:radical SAM superfamily enzyme YgiQ (UPF0313 family)